MKPSQIAQLQDLSRCYMRPSESDWVRQMLAIHKLGRLIGLPKRSKAWLRRLTHQYRNQIRACKRNQSVNKAEACLQQQEQA
jgi:hypothetical protein